MLVALTGCDGSSGHISTAQREINVTNDLSQRWGEPQLSVNSKNPNNIVYLVMSNAATYACQASGDPACDPTKLTFGQMTGFFSKPGFYDIKLFVTFDGGLSWKTIALPDVPAPRGLAGEGTDHPNLLTRSDPMVTVDANGTFYIGWDAIHNDINNTPLPFVSGGIAVSKSTDGGLTWSTPVLTGTGIDRPWMATDLSTGTIYEASAGFVDSAASTANPALPVIVPGQPRDRWVVSSTDGVNWTAPQRLGSGSFGGSQSTIAAANGVLAAAFAATDSADCAFFAGASAPCLIFETSTDAGTTWARHVVPGLENADVAEGKWPLVAADPSHPGTFTVATLNETSTALLISTTADSGATWSTPVSVTDDTGTEKFKAALAYSPGGMLGMLWRSHSEPGEGEDIPYNVFTAISKDQGLSWSSPLKLTSAHSPGADPLFSAGGLDDFSRVILNENTLFAGWGDWRPGEVQGYFGRVGLREFSFKKTGN